MQVRRAGDGIVVLVQGLREVGEVVAVAAYLSDRVQPRIVRVPVDQHQLAVVLPRPRLAPLLQLDDDIRRLLRPGMLAGEDDVRTFRGERQVVLDQDLDVVQAGLDEVLREDREAAFPGGDLGGGGAVAGVVSHLFCQSDRQRPVHRQRGEAGGGVAEQRHGWIPQAARTTVVRVGACPREREGSAEARRAAPQTLTGEDVLTGSRRAGAELRAADHPASCCVRSARSARV